MNAKLFLVFIYRVNLVVIKFTRSKYSLFKYMLIFYQASFPSFINFYLLHAVYCHSDMLEIGYSK